LKHLIGFLLICAFVVLSVCMWRSCDAFYAAHVGDPDGWYVAFLWYHLIDLRIRFIGGFALVLLAPGVLLLSKPRRKVEGVLWKVKGGFGTYR
jgi:hypothetical protein